MPFFVYMIHVVLNTMSESEASGGGSRFKINISISLYRQQNGRVNFKALADARRREGPPMRGEATHATY